MIVGCHQRKKKVEMQGQEFYIFCRDKMEQKRFSQEYKIKSEEFNY